MKQNKTILRSARAALLLVAALLTNTTAWAEFDGTYIDENGEEQTCTEDHDLKSNYRWDLDYSWYFVEDDLTIDQYLRATCDINLILCDGATLTITYDASAIQLNGHSLTIYGQSAGTGKLIATSTYGNGIDTYGGGSLTINGGTVEVTSDSGPGFSTNGGSLTLNRGYLKATGGDGAPGIEVFSGSITLNGGAVKASGYSVLSDQITIADGKTYYDDMGNSYTGTINLLDDNVNLNDRVLSTYGGTCGSPNVNNGKDVTWYYNIDTKALTISGTGAMNNYNSNEQPWNAFMSSITSVSIGSGVTRIGDRAFFGCTNLANVSIGSGVTTIGDGAFFGCTNLATVSGGDGVTFIDSGAFGETAWDNGLPDDLTMVGSVAYRFVGGGTSVSLPEGTTQIYDRAFTGSAITSIIIPASVTYIGANAFEGSLLNRVYFLSTQVPTMINNVFESCTISAIVVPEESYSDYGVALNQYNLQIQPGYTIECGEGITATSYAPIVAEDEEVTLQNADPSAPLGYKYGFTVKDAGDNDITNTYLSGNTLTMPDNNVTVSSNTSEVRSTGQAVSVSYIDEHGETQPAQAVALDGTETTIGAGGQETWYFVGLPTVNFDHRLELTGDITLILADGCTMNIGTSESRINDTGITAEALTIYGQTLGTGALNVYTTGDDEKTHIGISTDALTINGGKVSANDNGAGDRALNADYVTINAGTVSAICTGSNSNGICGDNTVTINGGNITARGTTGIYGHYVTINGSTVTATGTEDYGIIGFYNVTINGSTVNATGGTYGICATNIYSYGCSVTITGGNVTATGGTYGICAINDTNDRTITLGWTNYSDCIKANSYEAQTFKITNPFTDGTNTYIGEESNDWIYISNLSDDLDGKTLYPYVENLDLAARQAPDQNYWTTFYCGHTSYQIADGENACAYTAQYNAGNAQLTLHKLGTDGKQIPANCAVIIVADNAEVSLTALGYNPNYDPDDDDNSLRGVDADTNTDDIREDLLKDPNDPEAPVPAGTFYVLGQTIVNNEPHFGFHRYTGTEMAARKAFLLVPATASNARALTMVFGDETGITTTNSTNSTNSDDAWYTIDGRKLSGKPTAKGIYVNKGIKVVIK